MAPRKVYKTAEVVYGKWPGSSLFYKGVIEDYEPDTQKYTIKFDNDDSSMEVPAKDVMATAVFERRSGSKSRGSRSRSRSSSPSRKGKRTTSKSPTRKSTRRSPLKESPVKSRPERQGRSPRSPARVVTQKLLEVNKSLKRVSSEASAVIQKEEIITQSRGIVTSDADSTVETMATQVEEVSQSFGSTANQTTTISHTSSLTRRKRESKSDEKVVHHRMTTRSAAHMQQEQQKEIENLEKKKETVTLGNMIFNCLACISKSVGYLAIAIVPICVTYWMLLSCNRKECTFLKLPKLPKTKDIFDWTSFGVVFGWYFIHAILAVLPVGRVEQGPVIDNSRKKREVYRINGLFAFAVTLLAFGISLYLKKFPVNYIKENYSSLVTASFIWSFILSIMVYIQVRWCSNSRGDSGGVISDFVYGCSTTPRFFKQHFDVKLYAFRTGNIGWAMMNIYFLTSKWEWTIMQKNPSLVLLTAFQVFYSLIHIYYEETFLYTASLSVNKMGYLGITGMLSMWPVFCSMQAKYLTMYPVNLPWYCYVVPVLLQVGGAYIYTMAQLQKFYFRKDPHQAKITGVSYIHHSSGRDILTDGWWGRLRHPNYTGDFMMNLAWSGLCAFHHVLPWVWSINLFLLLIFMAIEDDKKCQRKYGTSWTEYRQKVRYSFIPFLY